ncbi:MAG: helix-turn-helix transcriptional regulator [Methylophilaceae bacterium]
MNKIYVVNEEFGTVLKNRRELMSMTQQDLALDGELSRAYISELEKGHKNVSLSSLFKLSYALKVKPSHLMYQLEARI